LAKSHPGAAHAAIPGGFLLTIGAVFGYAAGWNPYASDYSRYLPPKTSKAAVGWWAAAGLFLGCVVLEIAGAASATAASAGASLDHPTRHVPRPARRGRQVHRLPADHLLLDRTLAGRHVLRPVPVPPAEPGRGGGAALRPALHQLGRAGGDGRRRGRVGLAVLQPAQVRRRRAHTMAVRWSHHIRC